MTETIPDVLGLCPNYQKIINFGYQHNDSISKNLIRSYQDYLFSQNPDEFDENEVKELDETISYYVSDHHFYDFVQANFYTDELPYYLEFPNELKRLKNNYELISGMMTPETKWL